MYERERERGGERDERDERENVCERERERERVRERGEREREMEREKERQRQREVHHPGNIAGSSQAHWFSLLLKAECFRRILATCIGRGKFKTNYIHHCSRPLLHDAGPVRDIERKRNFPEEDG